MCHDLLETSELISTIRCFDIKDLENDDIESLEDNRYDIVLSGSIVTHYKWMKWLANRVGTITQEQKLLLGILLPAVYPNCFLRTQRQIWQSWVKVKFQHQNWYWLLFRNEDFTQITGIAYKKSDGTIAINPKRKGVKKLDEFPMIDWNIFDTEAYFKKSYAAAKALEGKEVRVMPVVTARGCAFRCTFCHFVFENDPYRYRSPQNIIKK